MKCHTIHNYLLDYFERRLNPGLLSEVENHVTACKECREYSERLQEALQVIDAEKSASYDYFMYTRIQAALTAKQQTIKPAGMTKLLQPLIITSVVIIMVFAGIGLGRSYSYGYNVADDYQTELYYLSEINSENIDSLMFSE